jgi:hypothetical protein
MARLLEAYARRLQTFPTHRGRGSEFIAWAIKQVERLEGQLAAKMLADLVAVGAPASRPEAAAR